MLDVFFKKRSEYNNKLNPLKGYLQQLTKYIAVKRSLSIEEARPLAIKVIKTYYKEKQIKYFEREENGDRVVKESQLSEYIKRNINSGNVLVPTFTSYLNGKVQKSILSEFIFVNVRKRSAAKKLSQKAKADGDMELSEAKNQEQSLMKIYNNALSGVFGQSSCVLHNPTAHNTLTSMTRTMTSISNANNEKLIAGNRYLPRGIDVLNSIVYISTYADIPLLKECIAKYNLHLPSVEDVVATLKYSSDLYFNDESYYKTVIIPYLNNLTPYERAAICYVGDFYHIRKFNDTFIRNLLDELTLPIEGGEQLEDPSVIHQLDEAVLNMAHCVLFDRVQGKGKDYNRMNQDTTASSVYKTGLHIQETLLKYKLFFNTFFMTNIMPTNSNRLNNFRRRTIVLSDTDSTCFTLDEWVTWYNHGNYRFDQKSVAMTSAVCYVASQMIVNILAIISKNMNVEEEQLNTLGMKNEWLWPVISPCEVSKHYFAIASVQEGNVFTKPEMETKGVHLKNSAVPSVMIKDGSALMREICESVMSNKKIRLNDVVTRIKNLEQMIKDSVFKGETVFLKKSKINNKEAYALDEFKSPYHRHQLWVDVFAPKYGEITPPPYNVVKIPTTVTSKTALTKWLNSIEDVLLRDRLQDWLNRYGKKDLPTFYLSEMYAIGAGIPAEIIPIIDIKRIIFDSTMQHRLILNNLGVMLQDDLTVSEQFV